MKEKSRNAVAKLIKTLNTLLTIYIIFGFITGIIAALFKSPYWWVLIIAMLPSAVIFGVLVTQLSDALNSIIEDMEKGLQGGVKFLPLVAGNALQQLLEAAGVFL